MTADEWRLYDALSVRFSKILYAFKFPDVLSFESMAATAETATGEMILMNQVRDYFHRDPLAQHVLRALAHAAVEEAKHVGIK